MAVVLLALLASAAVGWAVVDVVLRLARVKGGPKASRPNVGGHQATVLEEESGPYVLRGGTWIGVLERIAITGAVLAGQPELVAAVVAVKGLGRWAELRTDPALTERFIIGPLASYIVAAGCGYAGLWALGDF